MIDALHDPGIATGLARSASAPEAVPTLTARMGARTDRRGELDGSVMTPGRVLPRWRDAARNAAALLCVALSDRRVDSTYYAIPARRTAELWNERTPTDWFNVKAHR